MKKCGAAEYGLSLLLVAEAAPGVNAQALSATAGNWTQTATAGSRFYCDAKALTPVERAHHKRLTDKLLGARKQIVETAKGYEFQFTSADVTLAELADWVAAEEKCCPFFDFHIDLEQQGKLLCLRLTGEEGIKPFIRAEFHVPGN